MRELGVLVDVLGPAIQPFVASGGAVSILALIVWIIQSRKPRQSAEDIESERWDFAKMTDLRLENDSLRGLLRATETDCARGWSVARGMSLIAHDLYHALANVMQRLPEDKRTPMPPPVPTLEEMQGVSPFGFPERYHHRPEEE